MASLSIPLTQFSPTKPEAVQTRAGNYFVANYPPFGHWTRERVPALQDALDRPPVPGVDLGIYAHIPFCRKRCHFCYFRVYTDRNARQIQEYSAALLEELRGYADRALISGRRPRFVYFGGGTPSYLSAKQLQWLFEGMRSIIPWDGIEEVAFEAEPGTLNETKLRALRDLGVTRLSLGIEHFDDEVLELNGRAHRSKEVYRAYEVARELFPQINIDLIAGMLGESDERWHQTVSRAIALAPDSVHMYQMEIPYNTTIYRRMHEQSDEIAPVADWPTKRRWVSEAFDAFEAHGYSVASATTVVRGGSDTRFLYRDGLFNGSDLLSIGVSSFGHLGGVNYQNHHDIDPYVSAVLGGQWPTYRAYALSNDERYIREFALQMKNGSVDSASFARKFGIDPRVRFAGPLAALAGLGVLVDTGDRIGVNRAGLMQVDRLLYEFFLPEHREGRYA